MIDLATIQRLRELEGEATCGAVEASEFRHGGWSQESALFIASIVNAALDLLALAEEALAAREWLKAFDSHLHHSCADSEREHARALARTTYEAYRAIRERNGKGQA